MKTEFRKIFSLMFGVIVVLLILGTFVKKCQANQYEYIDFALGAFSMFAVHEGSHEIAMLSTGKNAKWEVGNNRIVKFYCNYNDMSKDQGLFIMSSGLVGQSIAAEYVLSKRKQTNFRNGMILFHVLNTVAYAINYFSGTTDGDLHEIEYLFNKETASAFAIGTSLISLWQGYRYLDIDNDYKSNINFMPINNGGIISLKIDF